MQVLSFAALLVLLASVALLPHSAGISSSSSSAKRTARAFTIQDDSFWLDGERVVLRSAEVHYHRIHPLYWQDRILRLKAMGANSVQVYVPWNLHQPSPETLNFEGLANLPAFLALLNKLDMLVLIRPGPYICAEWDFGGLPFWLMKDEHIQIRTYDVTYMKYVTKWWDILLPVLSRFMVQKGGPIIMMQIENEYGSYGDVSTNEADEEYMLALIDLARRHMGDELILYTTDFGDLEHMQKGSFEGDIVYTVGDFAPEKDYNASFEAQIKMNAPGMSPPMCSEFYSGWLVHWGEAMANTSGVELSTVLDEIMSINGSVNLYMGHGGSNFGFWAGANIFEDMEPVMVYTSDLTSYDYNCMISEGGDHNWGSDGDKYQLVADVLNKYAAMNGEEVIAEPASIPKVSYGEISVQRCAALLSERSIAVVTDGSVRGEIAPLSFEQLGQAMGFVLYSLREVSLHAGTNNLTLLGLHDRAHVLLDGVQIAIASRGAFDTVEITLQASTDEVRRLDILVENLGRINFGPFMTDRKGLLRTPLLNMEALVGGGMSGWEMRKLPLEDQHALAVEAVCTEDEDSVGGPVWYRGELFVEQVEGDTWLNMECWGKGVIWLNGFNLGRYWAWGPQQTLYVPAPLLREGTNDILVLELDGAKADLSIPTVSAPIFNSTEITCAK